MKVRTHPSDLAESTSTLTHAIRSLKAHGGYIIEGGSDNGDVIFVEQELRGNSTETGEIRTILNIT